MDVAHRSRTWLDYEQNGERPPFRVGQRIYYLSPTANQSVHIVIWVSASATCRADQLISTDSKTLVPAAIFVTDSDHHTLSQEQPRPDRHTP